VDTSLGAFDLLDFELFFIVGLNDLALADADVLPLWIPVLHVGICGEPRVHLGRFYTVSFQTERVCSLGRKGNLVKFLACCAGLINVSTSVGLIVCCDYLLLVIHGHLLGHAELLLLDRGSFWSLVFDNVCPEDITCPLYNGLVTAKLSILKHQVFNTWLPINWSVQRLVLILLSPLHPFRGGCCFRGQGGCIIHYLW
jgi:hypothetical protein